MQFTVDEYENAMKRAEKYNLPKLEGTAKDVEKAVVVRDRLFGSLMQEMSAFYAFSLLMNVHLAQEYIEYDYDTLRRVLLRRISENSKNQGT